MKYGTPGKSLSQNLVQKKNSPGPVVCNVGGVKFGPIDFRYQNVVILYPATSMSVSKRACLTIFTDFLSAVVTSEIAQILSLYSG